MPQMNRGDEQQSGAADPPPGGFLGVGGTRFSDWAGSLHVGQEGGEFSVVVGDDRVGGVQQFAPGGEGRESAASAGDIAGGALAVLLRLALDQPAGIVLVALALVLCARLVPAGDPLQVDRIRRPVGRLGGVEDAPVLQQHVRLDDQ
ncbi:hypothetical protein [Streptomyces mirabilis]|uniref:hypothetical protein n=1 Tax=Streptomyces mirabilis TaxID=68239 RepID=UPI0033A2E8B5